MIYIIYGTDQEKAGDRFRQYLNKFKAKNPEAIVHRLDSENFDLDLFRNYAHGQDLFGKNYLIACTGLLSDENYFSQLEDGLEDVKNSPNICLFYEYELKKPIVKKLAKQAEKIEEFKLADIKAKADYNIFDLTDALGSRDRKKLWVELQKASIKGVSEEDIFWKLDDHIKKMIIVKTSNPKDLNYHPFYLKKLTAQAGKYSTQELKDLSQNLAELYSQVRLGRKELDLGLEAFCLVV